MKYMPSQHFSAKCTWAGYIDKLQFYVRISQTAKIKSVLDNVSLNNNCRLSGVFD